LSNKAFFEFERFDASEILPLEPIVYTDSLPFLPLEDLPLIGFLKTTSYSSSSSSYS
jgi:hypothetical protein